MKKKNGRGILLLWNGFVFYVRGFGCVQNQVLSTYKKVHRMNEKWTIQSETDKKLVIVIVGLCSLRENAPTKKEVSSKFLTL